MTLEELTFEADLGDGASMVELGWRYLRGQGVKSNKDMAKYWFSKPEAQEHALGRYGYACCLPRDDQWLSLMKALASENYALAQIDLGDYYLNKDKVAAKNYLAPPAQAGNANAQYLMARCFKGTDAAYWYEKAADQGHAAAAAKLGTLYFEGKDGVEKNAQKAYALARKAADAGSSYGYELLGRCYYDGSGVAQDYDEAYRCFLKGVDSYYLGLCYRYGRGVKKDEWEAKACFERSNNPDAVTGLAFHYLKYSPYRDESKGVSLLKYAAERGEPYAIVNLGVAYEYGQWGVSRDKEEAVKRFHQAADLGYRPACRRLGEFYSTATPPDMEKARYWYACADGLRTHKPGNEPGSKPVADVKQVFQAASKPAAPAPNPVSVPVAAPAQSSAPKATPQTDMLAMSGKELYAKARAMKDTDIEQCARLLELAIKKGEWLAYSRMAQWVCEKKARDLLISNDYKAALKYYKEAIGWQKKYLKFHKKIEGSNDYYYKLEESNLEEWKDMVELLKRRKRTH